MQWGIELFFPLGCRYWYFLLYCSHSMSAHLCTLPYVLQWFWGISWFCVYNSSCQKYHARNSARSHMLICSKSISTWGLECTRWTLPTQRPRDISPPVVSALWSCDGEHIVSGMWCGCQLLTCALSLFIVLSSFLTTHPARLSHHPEFRTILKPQKFRPGSLANKNFKIRKKHQASYFCWTSAFYLHNGMLKATLAPEFWST